MIRENTICLFICLIVLLPCAVFAQNLALLAVASSSGGGVGTEGPANINDNRLEPTGYHWVTEGVTSWVELTWATPQLVATMWCDTNATYVFAPQYVRYWNGTAWVTVGDMSRATNDWNFNFGGISTTAVRFERFTPGYDPRIFEIRIFPPPPTPTPTPTPTGTWYSRTPTPTDTFTPTDTPTPTGTWYSITPTFTPDCIAEARLFSHWSTCENLRGPIPGSSSYVWSFDDCDYCRQPPNPCFTTPCTFAMYVSASCGRDFHVPLWDNETGNIRIWSCLRGGYMNLQATSTGGWTASGTNIAWKDCTGMDLRWNEQTTDIMFTDPLALCGVYRIEFINWGGFIWDLFANCTGGAEAGFLIYDNVVEATGAYVPYPEIIISNITVTGVCPNFTVGVDVSNVGCSGIDAPICVETTIGGHWEFTLPGLASGETRFGSIPIVAPSCAIPFTITVTVDCNDIVMECTEMPGAACNPSGVGSNELDYEYYVTPGPSTPTPTFTSTRTPTRTPTHTPTSTSTFTPTAPPTIFCCWEPAVNAGGTLNSVAQDWHPNLASDGTSLFFASARVGGRGKSDIWTSIRIGPGPEDWSPPVNLGTNINSNQLEAAPKISFDMQELFFEAYNLDNSTIDIFHSFWDPALSEWKMREPLSSTINYPDFDERHPLILRDGRTLYYDTDRPGGPGGFDIWYSERYRGRWSEPQPLPVPVNSSAYEAAPYVYYYPGGQQLYYETERLGSNQLFVCEWDPDTLTWAPPNRMCLAFINALFPSIKSGGSEMLYHSSGGFGSYDIWLSECLPTPTPKGTWYSPTPTVTLTVKPVVPDISGTPFLVLLIFLSGILCITGPKFMKHLLKK